MIQANELRIGNLISVKNEKYHPSLLGVPLEVTGISENVFENESTFSVSLKHINQEPHTYYPTYSQFLKFLQPIPLTPELLENAGFEKYMAGEHNDMEMVGYRKGNFDVYFTEKNTFHFADNRTDVELCEVFYVHQLQNLYFELMHKELSFERSVATDAK